MIQKALERCNAAERKLVNEDGIKPRNIFVCQDCSRIADKFALNGLLCRGCYKQWDRNMVKLRLIVIRNRVTGKLDVVFGLPKSRNKK
ncbi:hypothetical protein ES705_11433 [subsurface metagenome]